VVGISNSSPVYNSVTSRPWGRLDTVAFRAALSASALRSADHWLELSIHDLVHYITVKSLLLLDTLIPLRTVSCPRRPSDPWFDEDCRVKKRRCVQQLEAHAATSMGGTDTAAVVSTWTSRRRSYRALLRKKHELCWCPMYQLSVRYHVNHGIPLMS